MAASILPSDGGSEKVEGEVIEGGNVEQLGDYHVDEKHRADTARYLAHGLVATLILTIELNKPQAAT